MERTRGESRDKVLKQIPDDLGAKCDSLEERKLRDHSWPEQRREGYFGREDPVEDKKEDHNSLAI